VTESLRQKDRADNTLYIFAYILFLSANHFSLGLLFGSSFLFLFYF